MLETDRLTLRPFSDQDLGVLADLCRNPGFMQFSGGVIYSRAQSAVVLNKVMGWNSKGLPSLFAVILRSSGALIGYCGFLHQHVDETDEIEIAYRFHPDYWNKGIATEAAHAVRDHGFRDLNLTRVISLIHPENLASRRVAEKNGMKLEKETSFRGFPAQVFALTRQEWLAEHGA